MTVLNQGNLKKYFFLRMLLTIALAPLIAIPLLLLLFSEYSASYRMAMTLLPYVYLFTCLWGGTVHVVLVTLGRTELRYYIAAYFVLAIPAAIICLVAFLQSVKANRAMKCSCSSYLSAVALPTEVTRSIWTA